MSIYIDKTGIKFNNVKPGGAKLKSLPLYVNGLNGVDEEDGTGILNVINIDWNGAEIDENTVINTTGELLNLIKTIKETPGGVTEEYVNGRISALIDEAPETLNTLREIAEKLGDNDNIIATLESMISEKANSYDLENLISEVNNANEVTTSALQTLNNTKANTEDVYNKSDVDAMIAAVETIKGDQGPQGAQGAKGDTGTFDSSALESYATKTYVNDKITEIVGEAPETLDTLKEIADVLNNDQTRLGEISGAILTKANAADVYNKSDVDAMIAAVETIKGDQGPQGPQGDQGEQGPQGATGTFDSSALESYATKEYVDNQIATLVGGEDVSANFDTLKELGDAMADLKVVDVEAVPAVEGVKFTQEEIDAAQEGDEAYGKTVDDWKVEPVEAVEEQSHNMTIAEYVNSSMQAVDEKEDVAKVKAKYEALLSLINIRESQVNSVILNNELTEAQNNVTGSTIAVSYDEPVENVVIPETNKAFTVSAPLEDNSTVTLSSNKYMSLYNTNEEATSVTVQRPAAEGETGTSGTTVYLVGEYDTLTLENVSPNTKSGEAPAKVNNVVITEDNTKNLTLTLDLQDGATITNNSATDITITDKNNEETVLTVVAPNSTVTLNGGTFESLNAEVSDNTLIIKKTAHIGTLNVTKGNVKVEVARQSDIANVIDNYTVAEGYSVDYLHDEITSANIAKLTSTGTHILTEDIDKPGRFAPGIFASDDIVWNLNNHNIIFTNTQGYANFLLRGTLHLEINGEGIVRNNANDYGFWTATTGVKVVINGGTYYAATHVLYAEKGTIEVNGGEFHLTNPDECDKDVNGNFKFLLNCHDAEFTSGEAQIIVRGGTFYGFNPAVTYGEPGAPVSYVPEGYESVQIGTDGDLKIYKVQAIQA